MYKVQQPSPSHQAVSGHGWRLPRHVPSVVAAYCSRDVKKDVRYVMWVASSDLHWLSCGCVILWMFPKIVVPPNHPFWDFHYKPSILGYPYFWKLASWDDRLDIPGCFSAGESLTVNVSENQGLLAESLQKNSVVHANLRILPCTKWIATHTRRQHMVELHELLFWMRFIANQRLSIDAELSVINGIVNNTHADLARKKL